MHAIRNLSRVAFGTATIRWTQLGLRPHVVDEHRAGDPAQPVRVQGRHRQRQGRGDRRARRARVGARERGGRRRTDSAWLTGGTYLVARRIRMTHRDVGPHLAARAGERSSAAPRARALRCPAARSSPSPTSRSDGPRRRAAHRGRLPRPAGPPGLQRRGADAAPRLQLHRRQRRARPARRRAVLPRVRARPPHALHPDADRRCRATTPSWSTSRTPGPALFAVPPGVPEGALVAGEDGTPVTTDDSPFVGQQLFA